MGCIKLTYWESESSLKVVHSTFSEHEKEEGRLFVYGMRYYAPWICRFVSVDPIADQYPHYTPYQYAGNKPINYIDLDGAEEVSPQLSQHGAGPAMFPIKTYPKLKAGEWRIDDRECACRTFSQASMYNTKHLLDKSYEPVRQIHKYYQWAAQEIDKTSTNIKFFHAARDVTNFFGVGGAYTVGHSLTLIGDEAKQLLGDVNQKLLAFNMGTIKGIIQTGQTPAVVPGKEVMFDLNYVKAEQETVSKILDKTNPSADAVTQINSQINNFSFTNEKFGIAMKLTGENELDFNDEKQRIAIGFSDVILQHMASGEEFTDAQKAEIDAFVNDNLGTNKGFFKVLKEYRQQKADAGSNAIKVSGE